MKSVSVHYCGEPGGMARTSVRAVAGRLRSGASGGPESALTRDGSQHQTGERLRSWRSTMRASRLQSSVPMVTQHSGRNASRGRVGRVRGRRYPSLRRLEVGPGWRAWPRPRVPRDRPEPAVLVRPSWCPSCRPARSSITTPAPPRLPCVARAPSPRPAARTSGTRAAESCVTVTALNYPPPSPSVLVSSSIPSVIDPAKMR
jgi:hypothetical protein